jgi:hypothetical protein
MVGYNSDQDALTLGDSDSLSVGDYDLSYDTSNNEWQAEYGPSGDVTSLPTNVSGSLHPTDFADALNGKALADTGDLFNSIQSAVDNATGFVFVGAGAFNESVTISTQGLMLMGSGQDTLIDGGANRALRTTARDVTVKNLSVQTNLTGSGDCIIVRAKNSFVQNCFINQSGSRGIVVTGDNNLISGCRVQNAEQELLVLNNAKNIIATQNICVGSTGTDQGIFFNADNTQVISNIIQDTGSNGISVFGNDSLVGGNRVISAGNDGIKVGSSDCNIFNNRVSDSSSTDIDDSGTNTVLDGNKTGPAN